MIIPPSHPAGVVQSLAAEVAPAEVGALAGVRAVDGNGDRADEERAGSSAGVIFEHTPLPAPIELYGPDGRRVEGAAPAEGEDASPIQATGEAEESGETEDGEASSAAGEQELSLEEKQQVQELQSRDAEVRAHEAAHLAAGGAHTRGGASFTFTTGPDGKQYATGGEVGIDTSPVAGDPEATAAKARTIRAAALAPANPSGADRAIAASASQMEAQAMMDIATEQREQASGGNGTPWDQYAQQHQPADEVAAGSGVSLVA